MNDPTTPLAGLTPDELPTIHRPPSDARPKGFAPGSVVADRYRIVALLGRGGMGEVYRADDLRLGQPVALKFLSSGDARAIETVYHEVRIARQVSHPNVCRVHDVVEADGLRFIAMEYVDGEDLSSLLRRIGRLPGAKALEVAKEIAAGLAAAHDRGIVHRDLKPGNVMIDGKGHAHVTDFGLASLSGLEDNKIAGTPAYMAPEQVAGAAVTLRSDVYALGLVLYEIFTGERVYDSGSFAERRRQPVRSARRPASIVRDIEPAVDRVIVQCLEENPELRPASAHVVMAMLPGGDALDAALAAGETPSPEMVAAATESGELAMPVVAALGATIAVLLVVVVFQSEFLLYNLVRKPPEVLADRAADVVARAGEPSVARDETYSFEPDIELARSKWGLVPRETIAGVRPGIMRFLYRRAPSRLIPKQISDTISSTFIFRSGKVTLDDPPVDTAGNAAVVLDQNGGLVEYRARPSDVAQPTGWMALIEATGVDLKTLRPSNPTAIPPVSSTERAAWTARYPKSEVEVQIEAASLMGRPAWLRVYAPWHKRNAPPPANTIFGPGILFVIMVGSLIGSIILAVRNVRRARSDRRGGLRLAVYIGACLFLSWLIAAHHAPGGLGEARLLSQGVGTACGSGLILWLFYIALEPGARRRWPRTLIAWTRLFSGRFNDPMVGREVLVGVCAGMLGFEILWLGRYAPWWFGGKKSHFVHAETINSLRVFIADQLLNHVEAIEIGIGSLFFFLLFTLIVRKPAIATALWMAVFLAAAAAYWPIALYSALLLFVVLRQGLLACVVTGVTVGLVFQSPLTFDPSAWFFPRSLFVLIVITSIAAWAAYTALGTRRAALSFVNS